MTLVLKLYFAGDETICQHFLQLIQWRSNKGNFEVRLYNALAVDWKDLAARIGLDPDIIRRIGVDCPRDQLECIRTVMDEWRKDEPKLKFSYTWNGLCKVLNDINLSSISEQLKEALAADESSFKGV